MVLIKSCKILIGIRVKEQAAELVDINCLDLPVVVIIDSFSAQSSASVQTCQCGIAGTRTEYLAI